MKLKIALFAFSFVLCFACKKDNTDPQPSPTPEPKSNVHLDSGLLVYYPFTGSIADSSGNKSNGQVIGGTLSYDEHGKPNSAYKMSGNPDRIVIANNGSIEFDTAFSISLEISLATFGRQNFIAMVNTNTGKGPSFTVGTNLPNNQNLNFSVANDGLQCEGIANEENVTNNTSTFTMQPGSWYNVTCTFTSGVLKSYINGKLVATKNSPSPAAHVCPDSQLIIGGWWNSDPTSVMGIMDNVRVYNRTLNSDEIAELAKQFQ